jgi:hypothetical protein
VFSERRLSLSLSLSRRFGFVDSRLVDIVMLLAGWLAGWLLAPEALAAAVAAAASGTCKYQFETQGLMFGGIMAFYIFFPYGSSLLFPFSVSSLMQETRMSLLLMSFSLWFCISRLCSPMF